MPSPARRVALTPLPGYSDLGLVDALAQLSFAIHGALGRIVAAHGVSIGQARLIGICRDRRPTIKELAGFLALDKSSVTGLVDRAEERGLLRRVPSPVDGRSVQVVITPAGLDLAGRVAAAFEDEIAEVVGDVTAAERLRLSAVASRIVATDARRRGIDIFSATARRKQPARGRT